MLSKEGIPTLKYPIEDGIVDNIEEIWRSNGITETVVHEFVIDTVSDLCLGRVICTAETCKGDLST